MKFSTSTIAKCLFTATMMSGLFVTAQTTGTTPAMQTVPHQDFATELAKADLAKQGIAQPSTQQLADSVKSIQDQRASGLGWGQIAASLGLNLGNVVSAANRSPMAGIAGMKGTTGGDNARGAGMSGRAGSDGSSGSNSAGGGMSGGAGSDGGGNAGGMGGGGGGGMGGGGGGMGGGGGGMGGGGGKK